MATTGTLAIANEVKPYYDNDWLLAGQSNLYWDPLCDLRMVFGGERGISYNFAITESFQPSTGALNELEDITPQQMRVNEIVVTLQEFGGAVEVTKFAVGTSYNDVLEQAAYANGYSMAESLDIVVRDIAGQGGRVFRQNNRATRSVFAGQTTAADRLNTAFVQLLQLLSARALKMPLYPDGSTCTVMHPFPYYDLLNDSTVQSLAIRLAPEMLFNGELAYWSGLRIIVSANAKGFWGSGAALGSSYASTLAAAANVGDTNLKLTGTLPGNLVAGQWCTVQDAAEPGNTWTDTNELVRVIDIGTSGATGTGVDIFALDPGPGDGGGLRYAHASGVTFNNSNSVYPIVVLGPKSLTKAASDLTGPYGETVVTGPFDRLGRFLNIGWYLIGGFVRTRSGWIMRGEVGSSVA